MAMFDACWRFEEVVGQLRAFVYADITNRVRTWLKVDPRHRAHPWGSGNLENLFTGHLKALLRQQRGVGLVPQILITGAQALVRWGTHTLQIDPLLWAHTRAGLTTATSTTFWWSVTVFLYLLCDKLRVEGIGVLRKHRRYQVTANVLRMVLDTLLFGYTLRLGWVAVGMLRHLLIKLWAFIFTGHFKVSLRVVDVNCVLDWVGIITYSDRVLLLRAQFHFDFRCRVSGQELRLGLGAKIENILLDNVIFVFKFLLDSIDLALNGLDGAMGKLEVGVSAITLLFYLFLLSIFFVFMYKKLLDFSPALVTENAHGQLEVGELVVSPSAVSVLGVWGQLDVMLHD